ncbi:MAG: hypothetical protein V3W37_04690 [Candidatus Binatia bacterium]
MTKFHSLGQMVEENRGADNACIGKLSSNRLEHRVVGAACARIVLSLVQTSLCGLQRFFGFLNAHDGTIAGGTGLGNTPRSVKNNRGIFRLEQHMAAISDIMIFGLQLYWR